MHKNVTKYSRKNQGSAMLIAVFLSGLILTMGMAGSRMLMKEVKMSAQLWNSEQAYFSAESGIEKSLLLLEENPVEFVEDKPIEEADRIKLDLNIQNHKESFSFDVKPYGNQKFRLIKDTNSDIGASNNVPISKMSMKVETVSGLGSVKYNWKILCRNKAGTETVSIQKEESSGAIIPDVFERQGTDRENNPNRFNNLSDVNKLTCFFSVQNLKADENLKFTFTGVDAGEFITPNKAKILAIGKRNKQQKRIVFEYQQKNLGSYFDFTFLHTD